MSRSFLPTLRVNSPSPLSDSQVDANFLGVAAVANAAVRPYFAASQAVMLALTPSPQVGDLCFRSDISSTLVFNGGDPTLISGWLTATNPVASVFGRLGAVTAQTGDYTPAQVGAPSTTGTGASGIWGISVTGNAATVTSVTSAQVTSAPLTGYTINPPTALSATDSLLTALGKLEGNAQPTCIGDGATTQYLYGGGSIYRNDWQGNQLLYATARTNLALQSQTLDNAAWSTNNATVAVNADTAPDGTVTAEQYTLTGTGANNGYIVEGITLPAGGPYTISVWTKSYATATGKVGGPWLWAGGTGALVGGVNGVPGTFATFTGGWQRITFVTPAVATAGTFYLRLELCYGNAAITDKVSAWGAQLELGSIATPYIPTTTAAVTVTDYVLSGTGLVTLAVAPVNAAALTWSGTYYRRVRFDMDDYEQTQMFNLCWDGGALKLISVK